MAFAMRLKASLGQSFPGVLSSAGASRKSFQHCRFVFTQAAAQKGEGPVNALHDDVAKHFQRMAQGYPPNISTGQLVQLMYTVGACDVKTQDVGQVINKLMEHGYYRQTHPQKRDSYGPPEPPTVGLSETKRWATMMLLERLKREEQGVVAQSAGEIRAEQLRHGRERGGAGVQAPPCGASWCQCPPGSSGTPSCALFTKSWEQAEASKMTDKSA
eukprot:TRINITY_DN2451_c0_g1_i2.p1 TRINITY_DN2451_c0_g1~~TRINITY_DN2451_c0_g1_i2.p1  ORF type:complete len:215 (+),score=40.23 TRINITY_DN2451_c0_g1_i2:234-878(+)